MGIVVGRLSKRSWDSASLFPLIPFYIQSKRLTSRVTRYAQRQDSDLCLKTVIQVFKQDVTAHYSAVLLRLLARMIKERRFKVHPNVLSCLLFLRLRSELSAPHEAKKDKFSRGSKDGKQQDVKFKSDIRKKWMNKNRRKAEKEKQEVEKELNEASAEVDQEERSKVVSDESKNETRNRIDPPETCVCVRLYHHIANGNLEKPLCPLLFHSQTTQAIASASSGHGRDRQIRPSR